MCVCVAHVHFGIFGPAKSKWKAFRLTVQHVHMKENICLLSLTLCHAFINSFLDDISFQPIAFRCVHWSRLNFYLIYCLTRIKLKPLSAPFNFHRFIVVSEIIIIIINVFRGINTATANRIHNTNLHVHGVFVWLVRYVLFVLFSE